MAEGLLEQSLKHKLGADGATWRVPVLKLNASAGCSSVLKLFPTKHKNLQFDPLIQRKLFCFR